MAVQRGGIVALPLSIKKKGLLIVALPLLFQFIFVWLLLDQLNLSEQETLKEAKARDLIASVNGLLVHAYEASGALYIYAYLQDDMTSQKFETSIKDMRNDLRWLNRNITPEEKDNFDKFSKAIENGIVQLKDQKRKIELNEHPGNDVERLQGYKRVRQIVQDARSMVGVFDEEHVLMQKKLEERRRAIKDRVYLGLAGNIVIAFMIAGFFASSIERRLTRVLQNLDLFKRREKLLPPMAVTDEIGVVDRSFHEMADVLRKAERIKQDFVAMVGHDIRTPVTSIKNTLDMLDEELKEPTSGGLDSDLRELVTDAAGESRRLMTLTNNLLDLSRIELGKFQVDARPLDIGLPMENAARSLRLFAQSKKTNIELNVASHQVHADYDRVMQVLINLLSNAVKYSPGGSTIKLSAVETGNFVEVRVEDNGPGIPAEARDKVFDAYERLSEEFHESEGMGLGLAICKSIVVAHGGTIGVRAAGSNSGSEFWFKLPKSEGSP